MLENSASNGEVDGQAKGGMSADSVTDSVDINGETEASSHSSDASESSETSVSDSSIGGEVNSDNGEQDFVSEEVQSSKEISQEQEIDTSHEMNEGDIKAFTHDNIKQVPRSPGIYTIYDEIDEGRLDEVYIGKSKNDIRGRLNNHYKGRGSKDVGMLKSYEDKHNLKFSFGLSNNPEGAEAAELERIGGLPPGNKRRETSHLEQFQNEDKSIDELREMIAANREKKEQDASTFLENTIAEYESTGGKEVEKRGESEKR